MLSEQLQHPEQTREGPRIVEPDLQQSGTAISGGKTPNGATVTVAPQTAGWGEHIRDFRRSAAFPA